MMSIEMREIDITNAEHKKHVDTYKSVYTE